MIRMRGMIVIGLALVLVLFMVAFTSESFSLNSFLRPAPRSPRISKVYTQDYNSVSMAADNPEVIRALREQFLVPPSTLPYNLSQPEEENPSMGQAQRIDFILKGKRNGFYVECGALDGEIRSNTLFFERKRGWNGILIEADPKNFNQMTEKHRKAYMSSSCLAPTTHPTTVMFQQQDNQGHILGKQQEHPSSSGSDVGDIVEVQCFPLYSYMVALNVTTIDYFSLDVEGAEFAVLKTIPWDKVDITTLSVEFIHDPEGKDAIQDYMKERGYYVHSEVRHYNWLANDFIFVKYSKQ
ncbi:protein Star-like [Homarus americanus]|uniref:protein Star-like n=1 Tax=Homarus americanus TaxID=6706 RepID=UPI001C4759B8|nr:protein Star-like [Homarus americanus]XP_042227653.1 protein Star-like [Homarus americanus]XP_042227654.1 protein Star-like [Homarus americanus]